MYFSLLWRRDFSILFLFYSIRRLYVFVVSYTNKWFAYQWGVLYRSFGKSDILGDFLTFSKKYFASVRLFSFLDFEAKKKSKSDFRTPTLLSLKNFWLEVRSWNFACSCRKGWSTTMHVFVRWACPGESQYRCGATPPPHWYSMLFQNIDTQTIKDLKGPVKIYRVPRPGFGKNLPEKKYSPPFFSRKKKSSRPLFFLKKCLSPLF